MTNKSENYIIKALGANWSANPDHFSFVAKLDEKEPSTKGEILSEVIRLFYPLGWLSPKKIQIISFLQLHWMDRLGWDNALSKYLRQQYSLLTYQLKDFERITLTRKSISGSLASSDMELHVFCEAFVYLRQSFNVFIETKMLTAKNRVASIKCLRVPRLELCAALRRANLVEAVVSALQNQCFRKLKVYAWTDSTLTLAWLKEFLRTWKKFVCKRVAKIQCINPTSNWNYVPTEVNQANCASRGTSATHLTTHSLWWYGSQWLEKPLNQRPTIRSTEEQQPANSKEKEAEQAEKKKFTLLITHENNSILRLIQRTSSFKKLVGVFSYEKKFIQTVKQIKKTDTVYQKTQPKSSDIKRHYKESTKNPSRTHLLRKEHKQKITKASQGSGNDLHLPHLLSSTDLYQGRIALYSQIQRHLQDESNIIDSQSLRLLDIGRDDNSNAESRERHELAKTDQVDREWFGKQQIGQNEVSIDDKVEAKVDKVSRVR